MKSKYTPIERDILKVGVMSIRKNLYNMSDKGLLSLLEEAKQESIESNDSLWDSLLEDLKIEISKRQL